MQKIDHYNVLLVDDEYMLRQSLSRKISELDDNFRIAGKSSEGRSALREIENADIHVVFTDIRMPEMDGLSLAAEIHERFPEIITVILTGYADFDYAKESIKHGVFDYLLKPVSDEDLASVLERISIKLAQKYILPGDEDISFGGTESFVRYTENYIKEHFREEIDFGALAAELGFSSAYLSRIFTRSKGESPVKYLTGIRIEEAKRLLAGTDESISRVGELSGYADQFYFSRIFRKEVGENPTSYRKMHKLPG